MDTPLLPLAHFTPLIGLWAIFLFCLAYVFVIAEEFMQIRKSKPVLFASGFIWSLVFLSANISQHSQEATHLLEAFFNEYCQLFLFLLTAMTYVTTMEDRGIFEQIKIALVNKNVSLRHLFWISGFSAFFLSPFIDNLTTAIILGAVIITLARGNSHFIALGCLNIVIAANAGGAFSPFGDITTLMVWQAGYLHFFDFFHLFVPALISYIIPAFIFSLQLSNDKPNQRLEKIPLKWGAKTVVALFAFTLFLSVSLHQMLHLPPVIGMMSGLSLLMIFAYFIKKQENHKYNQNVDQSFDIFHKLHRAEWDTLLFFYGVMSCIAGLACFGYLDQISHFLYHDLGHYLHIQTATPANTLIGFISAIIDNIPVVYAVLSMKPTLNETQWLLLTLSAGIGGSLLSIGSAAGVALMGQSQGAYTFFSHLKWTPVILLGYFMGIVTLVYFY